MWIAPRSARGMLPPTGVWLAGSLSPSTTTRSPGCAARVMGWDAVPEVVTVMLSVRAYVPPRTLMVSPGFARSTAR